MALSKKNLWHFLTLFFFWVLHRSSPRPSPLNRLFVTESGRRRASDSLLERSTHFGMTSALHTHAICCPGIASHSPVKLASGGHSQAPFQNAVCLRRVLSCTSILKLPGQCPRWTYPRLLSTRNQRKTIVRFDPVVVVSFLTETGIESTVHTTPITNDTKDTRRRHFRRHKSLPIVKFRSISLF